MFFSSKKQIGVLYKAWKTGKVEMSRDVVDFMYEMAGRMVGNVGYTEQKVLAGQMTRAIDAILGRGDYARAQEHIDLFAATLARARATWGDMFTKSRVDEFMKRPA